MKTTFVIFDVENGKYYVTYYNSLEFSKNIIDAKKFESKESAFEFLDTYNSFAHNEKFTSFYQIIEIIFHNDN